MMDFASGFGAGFVVACVAIFAALTFVGAYYAVDRKRRRKTYQESADNEAPKTLGLRR